MFPLGSCAWLIGRDGLVCYVRAGAVLSLLRGQPAALAQQQRLRVPRQLSDFLQQQLRL